MREPEKLLNKCLEGCPGALFLFFLLWKVLATDFSLAVARWVSYFVQSWDGAQHLQGRKDVVREASTGDGRNPHVWW